jgi:hypothetical protein
MVKLGQTMVKLLQTMVSVLTDYGKYIDRLW